MLNVYSDAGSTQLVLPTQAFAGNGVSASVSLTDFTGTQLQSIYIETQTPQGSVTFTGGVGSGFSGLTVNALIGQRVIHNGAFVGTVVSNDATTVTISNLAYSAPGSVAVLSSYVRKALTTDYSVSGNTVTMTAIPSTTQIIHCVPISILALPFGGVQGAVTTTEIPFWIQASELYNYSGIQVQSTDLSQTQASLPQSGVTFASGIGSGFSSLVPLAMAGRAVTHNGVYVGKVIANDATTVTIDNTGYTNSTPADAVLFTIGSLQFAIDSGSGPGAFAPVIQPSALTNTVAVKLWVKDTITVPNAAMNYPNNIISIYAIESLAP